MLGDFIKTAWLPFFYCDSEWLVAEIDESDGTINQFNPEITVLLNLDWDHADYYKDFNSLKNVFEELLQRTHSKILIDPKNFEAFESRETFRDQCLFVDLKSGLTESPISDPRNLLRCNI